MSDTKKDIREHIEKWQDILEKFFKEKAGPSRENETYWIKKSVKDEGFPQNSNFFGVYKDAKSPTGTYQDLSVVIFPNDKKHWIIALEIGTGGWNEDYQLCSLPGTRRDYLNHLADYSEKSWIKNDFTDNESYEGVNNYLKDLHVKGSIEGGPNDIIKLDYRKCALACTAFDFKDTNEEGEARKIVELYLLLYAKRQGWLNKDVFEKWLKDQEEKDQKKEEENNSDSSNEEPDPLQTLLKQRKYIVLQGAPGTGKTYTAKKIVEGCDSNNIFFTQFHAETTYSDFVYGITPSLGSSSLIFKSREGIFVKAVKRAQEVEKDGQPVYLIIDEINRANLPNVLGPAFYLFEPSMSDSKSSGPMIELCPDCKTDKLPSNLYVIATMNTADRSLAMVDFALRRRFAWYTLYPTALNNGELENKKVFCTDTFEQIKAIFYEYASDEELSLQPGHSYFIVDTKNKTTAKKLMKDRLEYELMPLIKEYLLDGLLLQAKDVFIDYFRKETGKEMFL